MVKQYRGKTAKRPKMKVKKRTTKNDLTKKKTTLGKKKKTMRRRHKGKGGQGDGAKAGFVDDDDWDFSDEEGTAGATNAITRNMRRNGSNRAAIVAEIRRAAKKGITHVDGERAKAALGKERAASMELRAAHPIQWGYETPRGKLGQAQGARDWRTYEKEARIKTMAQARAAKAVAIAEKHSRDEIDSIIDGMNEEDVPAKEAFEDGFSIEQMKAAGYAIKDIVRLLPRMIAYDAQDEIIGLLKVLKSENILEKMVANKYKYIFYLKQMEDAGYKYNDIVSVLSAYKKAGWPLKTLMRVGFKVEQLIDAGYKHKDIFARRESELL